MDKLLPPVTLGQLMEEWGRDSPMDLTDLMEETAKIPVLHSKYITILSHHKALMREQQLALDTAKKVKIEWFSGRLNSQEDLERHNLEPSFVTYARDAAVNQATIEPDVIDIAKKVIENEEIVEACVAIIKEINNRTYQLGTMTKWYGFSKGLD